MLSNLERLLFAWLQSLMLGLDDDRLVNRLSDIQQNKQFIFIFNVYIFMYLSDCYYQKIIGYSIFMDGFWTWNPRWQKGFLKEKIRTKCLAFEETKFESGLFWPQKKKKQQKIELIFPTKNFYMLDCLFYVYLLFFLRKAK